MTSLTPVQQTQVRLGLDRPLAHATLFRPYPKNAELPAKAAPAKKAGAKRKY